MRECFAHTCCREICVNDKVGRDGLKSVKQAADVRFEGSSSENVYISKCTFTASNSPTGVASLFILGPILSSVVSDCVFTQPHSDSGSFI